MSSNTITSELPARNGSMCSFYLVESLSNTYLIDLSPIINDRDLVTKLPQIIVRRNLKGDSVLFVGSLSLGGQIIECRSSGICHRNIGRHGRQDQGGSSSRCHEIVEHFSSPEIVLILLVGRGGKRSALCRWLHGGERARRSDARCCK